MVIPFFTARRRKKLFDRPFSAHRERMLSQSVPGYDLMPAPARNRLRDMARVLMAEKHWEGCAGLKLVDDIKLAIAAQAALLLVGMNLDPLRDELYPNLQSVLVYPDAFKSSGPKLAMEAGGLQVMSEGFTNLGEAWHRGPVVVSWADAQRGTTYSGDALLASSAAAHNVVIHEFAHKLDMLDGAVNGTPPLESAEELEAWKNTMTRSFIELSRSSALGMPTLLNPYGATNPGEFFAVASEAFFVAPHDLQARDTDLYNTLKTYYRQDPASWTAAEA